MKHRRDLAGLTAFLSVAALLTWMVHATLQRDVTGDTDTYAAVFTDVSGLRAGDDVRVAGVRVGRVDAIDIDGPHAKVTFRLRHDQTVYGDTLASVTYQNLIGQRYLDLSLSDFGDPAPLPPGARIPLEHTRPSFDISALLNGFQPLFSTLDPQDVDNLTAALIRALQGDDGAVAALITETATLAQTFAGPDQILGALIDNLSAVMTALDGQSAAMRTTIAQTRKIFDGLESRRDTLLEQTGRIATVLSDAAAVVEGASPALNDLVRREPGFARHFVDGRERFAYLGFNIPLLLQAMVRATDSGAWVKAYVCDIGFSVVPGIDPVISQILGAASPTGTPQNSAICR
ncbi:MCE family protein [Nocardia bovistercoris]|uniref:MCE family protein n=1 Tax=Nocardia bovistercoris TaxID=2785916 RepID=A0A931IGQ5_9NOCA|nr:MCE family protein [Nocardia bovistercoris]MBH0779717.1 MCE family protein [Nocardia bovistercoris]